MLSYALFWLQEFPAHFALCEEDEVQTWYDAIPEKDLGYMLYDLDYFGPKRHPAYVFPGRYETWMH